VRITQLNQFSLLSFKNSKPLFESILILAAFLFDFEKTILIKICFFILFVLDIYLEGASSTKINFINIIESHFRMNILIAHEILSAF